VPEEGLIYSAARDVTDSRRTRDEQAALRRVATLVAHAVPPEEIFSAVAREVSRLFGTACADVLRYEENGSITVLGSAPPGSRATHRDVAIAVADARRAIRTEHAVGAPIVVEDRLWGVIAASAGEEPLPADAEARLASFTELVVTAIANAENRAALAASRARVVVAADEERRRVVRDLHDGAQQQLVSTSLTLKLAQQALADGDEEVKTLVTKAIHQTEQANVALRELAQGILPAVLTRGGLYAAVRALASRMPLPVENSASVGRLPADVEATAYFVVAEALTNVVKHAGATRAEVTASVEDGTLHIGVRDDGVGGAGRNGSGLLGLRDRLDALDGQLSVESPTGRGTLVAAHIPLTAQMPE
jgi:signal transduction histidine kinase